jgi:SAM-dependent methyltransferase
VDAAARLAERSAVDYADFLLPHLRPDARLLDVGCGDGRIAIGLTEHVGKVVGVDLEADEIETARRYARELRVANAEFRVGDATALDLLDASFDACYCHSLLEAVPDPLAVLSEGRRVLRPGGVVGAACVDYGGLILGGPHEPLLRRFYAIRERLWQLDAEADPYLGRALRGLLTAAGFERVAATTKAFSYGTDDAVASFGAGRAADCRDEWYVTASQAHGLATAQDLDAMERAWLEWSESPEAYAAFAWCRAIGYKPDAATR